MHRLRALGHRVGVGAVGRELRHDAGEARAGRKVLGVLDAEAHEALVEGQVVVVVAGHIGVVEIVPEQLEGVGLGTVDGEAFERCFHATCRQHAANRRVEVHACLEAAGRRGFREAEPLDLEVAHAGDRLPDEERGVEDEVRFFRLHQVERVDRRPLLRGQHGRVSAVEQHLDLAVGQEVERWSPARSKCRTPSSRETGLALSSFAASLSSKASSLLTNGLGGTVSTYWSRAANGLNCTGSTRNIDSPRSVRQFSLG